MAQTHELYTIQSPIRPQAVYQRTLTHIKAGSLNIRLTEDLLVGEDLPECRLLVEDEKGQSV